MGPQHADTGGVEGGDPHALGDRADETGQPCPHLVGRLVGEGDGEDLPRRGVAGGDEMGDAVGKDPGLARSRPRHHQQGAAPVDHGPALGVVQALEQLVGPGKVIGPARPPGPRSGRLRIGLLGGVEALELVDAIEGTEPAETGQRGIGHPHSHSMVPGGFDVMSRATRLTPSTSLMMRDDRRSSRS